MRRSCSRGTARAILKDGCAQRRSASSYPAWRWQPYCWSHPDPGPLLLQASSGLLCAGVCHEGWGTRMMHAWARMGTRLLTRLPTHTHTHTHHTLTPPEQARARGRSSTPSSATAARSRARCSTARVRWVVLPARLGTCCLTTMHRRPCTHAHARTHAHAHPLTAHRSPGAGGRGARARVCGKAAGGRAHQVCGARQQPGVNARGEPPRQVGAVRTHRLTSTHFHTHFHTSTSTAGGPRCCTSGWSCHSRRARRSCQKAPASSRPLRATGTSCRCVSTHRSSRPSRARAPRAPISPFSPRERTRQGAGWLTKTLPHTPHSPQRHLCNASTVQYIDMAVYASTPLFAEMCMVPKVCGCGRVGVEHIDMAY
jgi:hypothetical protein